MTRQEVLGRRLALQHVVIDERYRVLPRGNLRMWRKERLDEDRRQFGREKMRSRRRVVDVGDDAVTFPIGKALETLTDESSEVKLETPIVAVTLACVLENTLKHMALRIRVRRYRDENASGSIV